MRHKEWTALLCRLTSRAAWTWFDSRKG